MPIAIELIRSVVVLSLSDSTRFDAWQHGLFQPTIQIVTLARANNDSAILLTPIGWEISAAGSAPIKYKYCLLHR